MKCECGYNAFYYEKIEDNKKFNVYKCGHAMIESKRKTKCNMYIKEYISDIKQINDNKIKSNTYELKFKDLVEKNYKDLYNYINLCEITKDRESRYRSNYISNINFILKKLGFPLYFEDKETLDSLKIRIKSKPKPKSYPKSDTKTTILEVPDYLSVNRKNNKSIKKIRKKTSRSLVNKFSNIFIDEEKDENTNIIKNIKENPLQLETELDSDLESDYNSNDEDNTFDIDNYDSENDYEDIDDGGAFSD